MGRKVTMQPGDWIAKEDIRNEHHLENIRDAVRDQGFGVSEVYGDWFRKDCHPDHQVLLLDEDGDLMWAALDERAAIHHYRIYPDDLLNQDQTAGPSEYASLWFVVPEYGKEGAKVVNYNGEQVASFEEKTEAIEAVEAYNRTILEGNR